MSSEKRFDSVRQFLNFSNEESGAPFSALLFGNAFSNDEFFLQSTSGVEISPEQLWRWSSFTNLLTLTAVATALEDGVIEDLTLPVSSFLPSLSKINSLAKEGGVHEIIEGLGDQILLSHLIEMSSGLGSFFWKVGSLRSMIDPEDTSVYPSYIRFLDQEIAEGRGRIDPHLNAYLNFSLSLEEMVENRSSYPLLANPGSSHIYGIDYQVLTLVLKKALEKKEKKFEEYLEERILTPLGMSSTSVTSPKGELVPLFFLRSERDEGAGQKIELDRIYTSKEEEAQNDGLYRVGLLEYEATGTLSDLAKLIRFLLNEETTILPLSAKRWILEPRTVVGKSFTAFGAEEVSLNQFYEVFTGATITNGKDLNEPLPVPPSLHHWSNELGTVFYFDTETGDYLIIGTQVPTLSWGPLEEEASYTPDAQYVFQSLFLNFEEEEEEEEL